VVWVEGSPISRNPAQPAHGIATLDKPFTIGANAFNDEFGQGFYGWIGDVRISNAPLDASDFLGAH
jgi:hypothetical protein